MKLHQRAFLVFLLLLPTQLSYHFWPSFSFVNALRIDYLSPTIFLTDIIFLVFTVLWLFEKKLSDFRPSKYLIVLTLLAVVNTVFSLSPVSSMFHWLRILQVILLYVYVLDNNFHSNKVLVPLSLSILFTLFLSIIQLANGSNLGGPLYWLGERPLSIVQPGIALFSINGTSLLRPYATFPHPNAMAGYAGMFLLFALPYLRKNILVRFSLMASFLLIGIAFSQAAWLGLLIALLLMKVNKTPIRLLFTAFVFLSLLSPVLISYLDNNLYQLPLWLSQRIELSQISGKAISQYPLLGVGLGQFIRTIPMFTTQNIWWLQPVHNIPLLVASEMGLLGLITIFILIKKYFSTVSTYHYSLIIFVLVTSFVDHYWLTGHQNLLLIPILFATIKTHDLIHK